MTPRQLTFSHQTTLAVKIIIEDETGVLAFSIIVVTKLFACFRQLSQLITAISDEVSGVINDLKAALDFTAKVFAIGFNSLAYGLGMKL
jgi:hypothetical protein